ncbi:hypothetical protein [Psychrobacter sp. 4Bb]|uniref:hypothetical protein n=1 Tax=Psychrobacter sp. 4Bb TaxID=888436 RepID=UPI000C7ACD27|nr:hypothetical protein [Psychrobacter sp. 4Bb]PKH81163.1 hypothetical protein CXF60_06270 [Psychrobacter sp. 4Bb]
MDSIVIFAMGFAALIAFVASLWYLFQTVRIMWSYNSLLAIAAVLFSPLVHIAFYFIPKDGFDNDEKRLFKKYFLSIAAIFTVGILAAVIIPTTQQSQSNNTNIDETAEVHFAAIFKAHPDADKIVESPEFEAWRQRKSGVERDDIERVLREGYSEEVIDMLTLFKKETS